MDDFNADNAAIDAVLGDHTAKLARRGNCRPYVTSYTGDGRSNSSSPMKLTFPTRPYLVIISGRIGAPLVMVQGVETARLELSSDSYSNYLTWSGSSVSWWCNGDYSSAYMMTERGTTYRVIALLSAED